MHGGTKHTRKNGRHHETYISIADVQDPETRAVGSMIIYRKEDHGRRFADLRPSVGDSGSSSSTKRTLVFIELLRSVRGRIEEAI